MTAFLVLSVVATVLLVLAVWALEQRRYWRNRALYAEALEAQRAIAAQQRPLPPYIRRMMGLGQ